MKEIEFVAGPLDGQRMVVSNDCRKYMVQAREPIALSQVQRKETIPTKRREYHQRGETQFFDYKEV